MHIEPGYIAQAKVMLANVSAIGLLGYYVKDLLGQPADIVRTLLAALCLSLFMQSFSTPVGPSELHFVGAMAMYLTLGFLPTLIGFAIGLLLQGLLFDPLDLPHLAINSLSLMLPLIAVHYTVGRRLRDAVGGRRVGWASILKLDVLYYGGVTAMVGFWLMMGEAATPFSAWLTFAASYLAIVAVEPFITLMTLKTLKRYEGTKVVRDFTTVGKLNLEA